MTATIDASGDGAPALIYRRALAKGRLDYQRCTDCARAVFYPRVLCPHCGSTALGWHTSSGAGVVASTTTVHRKGETPYNVALIDLEDGFRVMTNVVGTPADHVRIGLPVRLCIQDVDGVPLPLFEVAR